MNLTPVKTALIRIIGPKATAHVQAMRFVRLLRTGRRDDPEFRILGSLVGPGDVTVDVGANGADWTYELARRVGPTGFVYAFEADPYYALATELAMRKLGLASAKLFPFGLSDRSEDLPLRIETDSGQRHSGLGFIDRGAKPHTTADRSVAVVKLVPLDSLVAEHPRLRRTTLIKVDVEGFELFVVRGAAAIIDEARPFVFLETGRFEKQGYSARDLHRFFAERRYRALAPLGPDSWALTDDALERTAAVSVNRLLVPEEKWSRVAPLVTE